MRRMYDRVGGLDVHRDSVVACVEVFDGRSVEVDKQTFSTTVAGVGQLGEWLAEREVELVVMEATGVYWRPVYLGCPDESGQRILVGFVERIEVQWEQRESSTAPSSRSKRFGW